MPIYNTANYLSDAIDSLIQQTVGFQENIELILVNDGSEDNSEAICLDYQTRYPTNIIYVKKRHGGLSSARNAGLDHAHGLLVNFIDSDDLWEHHALEYVQNFYSNHSKDIDMIACRMKFFEAETGFHALDYKFKTTRVINLLKEYSCVQNSVASAFFKTSVISKYRFIEGLTSGEDTRLINQMLLEKPIFGVVRESLYLYRRRFAGGSIVQTAQMDSVFYLQSPKYVQEFLLNEAKARFGIVPKFIQYMVMYDLQWRIASKLPRRYLQPDDLLNYSSIIRRLLTQIDDSIILEQRSISWKTKLFCISLKRGIDVRKDIREDRGRLFYNRYPVMSLRDSRTLIQWYFVTIKNNTLYLEGRDACWLSREVYSYLFTDGNSTFFPTYQNFSKDNFETLFGTIQTGRIVKFDIPLSNIGHVLKLFFSYENKLSCLFIDLHSSTHLRIVGQYYTTKTFTVLYNGWSFTVYRYKALRHLFLESRFWLQLYRTGKAYIIPYRFFYWLFTSSNTQRYILFDRYSQAKDNGEELFKYLLASNHKGIRLFYAIKRDTDDYQRLKALGSVLPLGTFSHKLHFLLADKLISSSSNRWVDEPFGLDQQYICDLLHFDFVFLQHGLTKDDVSTYLHKYNRNFRLFITSTKREYESILTYDYFYNSSIVKLTGMPRFDRLIDAQRTIPRERLILVIPTWRSTIKGTTKAATYESVYSPSFKTTEFFRFYDELINSHQLLQTMKEYGYVGLFCLHPSLLQQWIDFRQNSLFEILSHRADYGTLFARASLMITDYSSVFFDFAFLKKPVIYAHFDVSVYRLRQYSTGYFNYSTDGFGPVCMDLNSTIHETVNAIRRGCSMETQYLVRVDEFFTIKDSNNSQRVANEIKKLIPVFMPSLKVPLSLLLIIVTSSVSFIAQTLNWLRNGKYRPKRNPTLKLD